MILLPSASTATVPGSSPPPPTPSPVYHNGIVSKLQVNEPIRRRGCAGRPTDRPAGGQSTAAGGLLSPSHSLSLTSGRKTDDTTGQPAAVLSAPDLMCNQSDFTWRIIAAWNGVGRQQRRRHSLLFPASGTFGSLFEGLQRLGAVFCSSCSQSKGAHGSAHCRSSSLSLPLSFVLFKDRAGLNVRFSKLHSEWKGVA